MEEQLGLDELWFAPTVTAYLEELLIFAVRTKKVGKNRQVKICRQVHIELLCKITICLFVYGGIIIEAMDVA